MPALDTDYAISHVRRVSRRLTVFELVLYPSLQRVSIMAPRNVAHGHRLHELIAHTLAGVYRPSKPSGH